MNYLYRRPGAARRVMHIERCDITGRGLMQPLCGERRFRFNTTINAPFGLGRPVCRRCLRVLKAVAPFVREGAGR